MSWRGERQEDVVSLRPAPIDENSCLAPARITRMGAPRSTSRADIKSSFTILPVGLSHSSFPRHQKQEQSPSLSSSPCTFFQPYFVYRQGNLALHSFFFSIPLFFRRRHCIFLSSIPLPSVILFPPPFHALWRWGNGKEASPTVDPLSLLLLLSPPPPLSLFSGKEAKVGEGKGRGGFPTSASSLMQFLSRPGNERIHAGIGRRGEGERLQPLNAP